MGSTRRGGDGGCCIGEVIVLEFLGRVMLVEEGMLEEKRST